MRLTTQQIHALAEFCQSEGTIDLRQPDQHVWPGAVIARGSEAEIWVFPDGMLSRERREATR